jgi:hypothetical protein
MMKGNSNFMKEWMQWILKIAVMLIRCMLWLFILFGISFVLTIEYIQVK